MKDRYLYIKVQKSGSKEKVAGCGLRVAGCGLRVARIIGLIFFDCRLKKFYHAPRSRSNWFGWTAGTLGG
jgi:hypothetical protein